MKFNLKKILLLLSISLIINAKEFNLDSILDNSLSAGQTPEKIYESKRGIWILAHDKQSQECSVIFFDRKNESSISYRGPRASVGDKGSLVFIHPSIPSVSKASIVSIELKTDGEPSQTISAALLPKQGDVKSGLLISTSIIPTITPIQQSEKVTISLDGKKIYYIEWDDGAYQARDALLNCLNGN